MLQYARVCIAWAYLAAGMLCYICMSRMHGQAAHMQLHDACCADACRWLALLLLLMLAPLALERSLLQWLRQICTGLTPSSLHSSGICQRLLSLSSTATCALTGVPCGSPDIGHCLIGSLLLLHDARAKARMLFVVGNEPPQAGSTGTVVCTVVVSQRGLQ